MQHIADLLPQPKRIEGAEPEIEEPVCPACAGSGLVRHMKPIGDPDFGKAFPCEVCLPQRVAARRAWRLQSAGLPGGSRHPLTFDTWEPRKELTSAFDTAKAFSEEKAAHPFLTLSGPCGTGKTHLAVAIAHVWIATDRGMAFYWQAESLLDELRRGYNREDGAKEDTYRLLDDVIRCSLLVLDDLGAQKGSDWAIAKLDEVIDGRYAYGRHTVVTTNRALGEHPQRIADRLAEGVCVAMVGPSWRRI